MKEIFPMSDVYLLAAIYWFTTPHYVAAWVCIVISLILTYSEFKRSLS